VLTENEDVLVVHVHTHVKPGLLAEFLAATLVNARASLAEPGVLRFDVIRDQSDESHVTLVEVYQDQEAAAEHKLTQHYATWRDAVAEMTARPRESVRYTAVFPPGRDGWESTAP
jgi:autoinducer 2-degrading protein